MNKWDLAAENARLRHELRRLNDSIQMLETLPPHDQEQGRDDLAAQLDTIRREVKAEVRGRIEQSLREKLAPGFNYEAVKAIVDALIDTEQEDNNGR